MEKDERLMEASYRLRGKLGLVPQSNVSSGSSMLGLMMTSSKGLMPHPGLLHPEPLPLQQATAHPYLCRRHSKAGLAQSLQGPLVRTRFCLSPWNISGGYGV